MGNRSVLAIIFILFLLNIFAWAVIYDLNQPRDFEVVFFDVGQGDAALIKTHLGHYILIDGGENSVIIDKLAKEIPFYRKEIDLIVLTHDHADHLGGLIDVAKDYDVANILWNGFSGLSALSSKWKNIVEENSSVKIAKLGQRIKSDDFFIDVLYPFEKIEKESFSDLNLSSIVLRVVYKEKAFLFMGDAYKSTEEELVRMKNYCKDRKEEARCRGMILDSDVLKVGHHGSKTSTSQNFINEVQPLIAVISAGENNRYGHPNEEVLEVLEKYDIKITRTDLEGDIKIILNND